LNRVLNIPRFYTVDYSICKGNTLYC
jgi:hypothetical protein